VFSRKKNFTSGWLRESLVEIHFYRRLT
jgi:hypothetical protein